MNTFGIDNGDPAIKILETNVKKQQQQQQKKPLPLMLHRRKEVTAMFCLPKSVQKKLGLITVRWK